MQSCPELRSEAVDYLEQDMSHQSVSQSAETIALVVDVTADEQAMASLKALLTEVTLTPDSSNYTYFQICAKLDPMAAFLL